MANKRQASVDMEEGPSRKQKKPDNLRAGTIRHMTLRNFMCHSLLDVVFSSNVFIVTGKNGSGKSAILTALIVGLGGKASLTNRGNSIKGFIKAGKASGSIEIQLNNEGPLAYKPEVYGKLITISRSFTASGSSSYKIKSEYGDVISTRSRDILTITTFLNIQVDNPICILNQEISRNFLSTSDPKNKFILFMKATGLERLFQEYQEIKNNKHDCFQKMREKESEYEKLQEDLKKIKGKIDEHKSILSLKEKKEQVQVELVWAQVRDIEVEVESLLETKNGHQEKLDELNESITEKETKIASNLEELKDLEAQLKGLKDTMEEQNGPCREVQALIEKLQNTLREIKKRKQGIEHEIQSKSKDVLYYEAEIKSAKENIGKAEEEKLERLRNVKVLEEKIKGIDDCLQTARDDFYQIRHELDRKGEEENDLMTEISTLDVKIKRDYEGLAALKREKGNELILYGRNMPQVKEEIVRLRSRFKQEPRGPLGAYVKVRDRKYVVSVEGFLGPDLLGAFIVDNAEDSKVLRDIFDRVWGPERQPTIITCRFSFTKHDVSKYLVQAPRDCIAVYNAIEISDPVVSNCIVDQSEPECVLLVSSDARAMELMSEEQNVPSNCKQCITITGNQYYPFPNYKTYGSLYRNAKYLQVDSKERICQMESDIEKMTKRKQAVAKQLQSFRADLEFQKNRRLELDEKIKKLSMSRTQLRRQIESVTVSSAPEVASINVFESELAEARKCIAERQDEVRKVKFDMQEVVEKIKQNEAKLTEAQMNNVKLEEKIRVLIGEIKKIKSQQKELEFAKETGIKKRKNIKGALKEAIETFEGRLEELKESKVQAERIGERPPELRKVQEIGIEIGNLSRAIAKIEIESDNIDDLLVQHQELNGRFRQLRDVFECLGKNLQELHTATEERERHYAVTENYFIMFMKLSFKKMLEFGNFKGRIDIDKEGKKLDLIVIPQQGSQGVVNTSNLSGGERSFSTVAFLYALWQCMDFPFYFLDEFDVYMDKLNRSKVTDILIHHANSKPHLQFVFLTPQDVSFVKRDVTVLRLDDPERFTK